MPIMAKNPIFVDTHRVHGQTDFFHPFLEWPPLGQNVIYQISVAAGPNGVGLNRNHIKYG